MTPPRVSTPPPIGTRVVVKAMGWAYGLRGVVASHSPLTERSKDERGPVAGSDCSVRLDTPVPTRWGRGFEITHAVYLLAWQIRTVPRVVRPDDDDETPEDARVRGPRASPRTVVPFRR